MISIVGGLAGLAGNGYCIVDLKGLAACQGRGLIRTNGQPQRLAVLLK
jgi:hypothetical protein